jgi:hypothetical protein
MSQETFSESDQSPCASKKTDEAGVKSHLMAIPSPEGMSTDEFKSALLSSLESEHIGTLHEIDRRLRQAKVLIEGYKIDPIEGYVAVKVDFMRAFRPDDDVKELGQNGAKNILEKIFDGLPGYVVVTDAWMKIENFGTEDLRIETTLNIEHTIVMKDGKYLCEWSDPSNPLHRPKAVFEKGPITREIEHGEHGVRIRYNL